MKARLFALFTVLSILTVPAPAESAGDLRHRIEQRLPKIDAFKEQEVIGENNRGYLEERKPGTPGAAGIVADENRDREAVYAYIAKQTGATADSVARARAKKIAANSRPGVWVQGESGVWIKK